MSKIKSLLAKETVTTVEFPEIDGFMVDLVYLNRDELMKIRNRSLTFKFNKRTRQREEEVDNDKFLEAYSEKAIKGWSGLKYKNLQLLFPNKIYGENGEEEIEYSPEEALELLKNSTLFDQFVTDAMNDFEQFSKTKAETNEKN